MASLRTIAKCLILRTRGFKRFTPVPFYGVFACILYLH